MESHNYTKMSHCHMFLIIFKITWGKNSIAILESKYFEDMLQHGTLHKDEHRSNFVCVSEEEKEF